MRHRKLKKLLVLEFGPDVNVANVAPDTVLDFEATRTGLGVAGPPVIAIAEVSMIDQLLAGGSPHSMVRACATCYLDASVINGLFCANSRRP